MEFENKQYDGPYEVSEVSIENQGESFRGILYYPPENYIKPYALIIYFHGFPQLFTLQEIVKSYKYLLDEGFAFLVLNFRGYRFSEGSISIESQISDGLKIFEFIKKMSDEKIFNLSNVNLIAEDFGAFTAINVCARKPLIKKLILVSPLLNIKKFIYKEEFRRTLEYINRFLPKNVAGIENIDEFIELTKSELESGHYNLDKSIQNLKVRDLMVTIGQIDKFVSQSEIKNIFKDSNVVPGIKIIPNMDHIPFGEDEIKNLKKTIKNFLLYEEAKI